MYPELLRFGWFSIPAFGVMVALGFLAGSIVAGRYAHKLGWSEDGVPSMTIYAIIGGIAGAKLMYVVVYWNQEPWRDLVFSRFGFVYYGGLIGGILAVGWYAWLTPYPWRQVLDVASLAVPVGQALGRVGCLLNGCCFGAPTSLPWAIRFPKGSQAFYDQIDHGLLDAHAHTSLPVHPTQIYELLAVLVIWGLLEHTVWMRKVFPGQVALTYLGLYALARFAVESLRADPRGAWPLLGISTSQGIALAMFVVSCTLWPIWRSAARQES